ncbi:zonular occludens toxin domain-containing protein [Sulfurimonas sp.]|uniref:zonular occludens toxin domain-containing protein n=1 Tax=Sulfurimonas sp. TaxID=2022749 RepID=UPI002B462B10|nr:zonular occludens toxin domain-containing protein [Sulfurimonas sp.]
MIDYFFGKPRTGKTYRAVDILYNDYVKDENASPKFTNIITNIGGFKFKEINQLFRDRGSKSVAYKLVWRDLYTHLSKLYEMALDDKSDEELNRYAYSHKINDALIILDEASLFMKRYDDVVSWWLAYHGHFKMRIIIIAQSPKQINAEYLVHAEIYYEAQPQSKQLASNKLRYIHYSEPYFVKDNKFSSNTITSNQKIFDLYKSGEVDKPKKMLIRFIIYILIALFISAAFFKFLLYRLSPDTPDTEENQSNSVTSTYEDVDYPPPKSDDYLLSVRCNKRYCWNTDPKYDSKEISLSYFKFIVIKHSLELEYSEIINEVYILTPIEKTLSKSTLSKLTDYYYFIPKELKTKELKQFFISKEVMTNKRKDFSINPFNINTNEENARTSALARTTKSE